MTIRLRIRRKRFARTRFAASVVAVALLLGGATLAPGEATGAAETTLAVSLADRIDRETILEVVRLHRRTASEDWRRTLADAIYDESLRADVDPLLVTSIVAKESSFMSRAVSRAGAVGLMQLRPWVAEDVAGRAQLEWSGLDTLHSPQLNVRLGIQYFKEMVARFEGDEQKALAAYHVGPTRLSRQLRQGTFRGSRYASDILSMYEELCCARDDTLPRT